MIFNKDMLSKLVLVAILAVPSGFYWMHAHAEEKHNETKTALEIHEVRDEIEQKTDELTQIHLSPNREEPYLVNMKQRVQERLRELRDRLARLKG